MLQARAEAEAAVESSGPVVEMRKATEADLQPLLALINAYAQRGQLLPRSEESLRSRLADFTVALSRGEIVGCGALTPLGPGVGEVRSLAVRTDQAGRGLGHRIVAELLKQAAVVGYPDVLALTRRVSFFTALGFVPTRRELYLDKLMADCAACPKNVCCDETAMVRPPAREGEFPSA